MMGDAQATGGSEDVGSCSGFRFITNNSRGGEILFDELGEQGEEVFF